MIESNLEVQTKNILNSNQFHSIRRLGKGGFGHVLLATKATSSSTFYAVKCISKKKMIKDPLLKKFLFQQINTMASLDHPNIVKLHKTFQEGDWYFLVMQYCDMGNLYSFQNKLNTKLFTKEQSVNIFNQILRGVEFIHKNNIIHRDLKLQNIFLKKNLTSGNFVCKIGDFGLARQLQGGTAVTNCGTETYMAPQILEGMKYDKKADIWSLGVLFYYLFTGDFPFKGINILNDIYQKCKQGFNLQENLMKAKINGLFKAKTQQHMWHDLFSKIFQLDPIKRISLGQIKQHPVLRKKSQLKRSTSGDITTNDEQTDQMVIQWQISRITYLKQIIKHIQQRKFLSSYLLSAYKFYMNKVLLYFLNKQNIHNYKTQQTSSPKLILKLQALEKQTYQCLKIQYQNLKKLISNNNTNMVGKQKIDQFEQGFNLKQQDFLSFKMGYRNTVGKVYEQVHKKFTDNFYQRAALKLKVFICHIINRVFEGQTVNQNLWSYFFTWLRKNKIAYSSRFYDFILLQEWIKHQKSQNLQKSQELINQFFYK